MVRAAIRPGGDFEITLGVPPEDKWEAFKLSETAGIMVHVTCERAAVGGSDD